MSRPDQAATIIQRHVRGYQARRRAHAMKCERAQRHRLAVVPSWDLLSTKMEEFSAVLFRRLFEVNPKLAELFPAARDESLRCAVTYCYQCAILHAFWPL